MKILGFIKKAWAKRRVAQLPLLLLVTILYGILLLPVNPYGFDFWDIALSSLGWLGLTGAWLHLLFRTRLARQDRITIFHRIVAGFLLCGAVGATCFAGVALLMQVPTSYEPMILDRVFLLVLIPIALSFHCMHLAGETLRTSLMQKIVFSMSFFLSYASYLLFPFVVYTILDSAQRSTRFSDGVYGRAEPAVIPKIENYTEKFGVVQKDVERNYLHCPYKSFYELKNEALFDLVNRVQPSVSADMVKFADSVIIAYTGEEYFRKNYAYAPKLGKILPKGAGREGNAEIAYIYKPLAAICADATVAVALSYKNGLFYEQDIEQGIDGENFNFSHSSFAMFKDKKLVEPVVTRAQAYAIAKSVQDGIPQGFCCGQGYVWHGANRDMRMPRTTGYLGASAFVKDYRASIEEGR